MSRPCSICSHSERLEIDRLLLRGESYRKIAERFGLSTGSISRHREAHIGTDLRDVREVMIQAREEALAEVKGEVKARSMEEVKAEVITEARGAIASRLELCRDHFDQLKVLRERAAIALETAEASVDLKIALQAIRELKDIIRLWAELEGRLATQPQINLQQVSIYHSPQWREVGAMLAEVLNDYPDLRGEIAARLKAMVKAAEAGGQDGA